MKTKTEKIIIIALIVLAFATAIVTVIYSNSDFIAKYYGG